LNIDWQVKEIEVSEKDLRGVRLKDIEKDFIY
jgi:dTDP-4-dehydrorhamnose 3,5-epimerase-like enzyme